MSYLGEAQCGKITRGCSIGRMRAYLSHKGMSQDWVACCFFRVANSVSQVGYPGVWILVFH
jgi:hypothetical protein